MQKTISIIGCGWLGLALAQQLQLAGYFVKGSTRSPTKLAKLQDLGIQSHLLTFEPELTTPSELRDFFFSNVLIICLTPQEAKYGASFHTRQIQSILSYLPTDNPLKIIYTSSTSIYLDNQGLTKENSEILVSTAVAQAEQKLAEKTANNLTILRLAGLMGYDRIPAKYFAGKKGLNTAEIPVNYVHRDDVIQIIQQIIQQDIWDKVYNVVAPIHPLRKEIYKKNCSDFGFEMPEFVENLSPIYKIVQGKQLEQDLNYIFKYPNPLDFYYEFNLK